MNEEQKNLRFAGQAIWIGGGASGMGEATAELLAGEGAMVCIADRQVDRGQAVADRINARCPGSAEFHQCDVACEENVHASIAATIARSSGRLDAVVNCAGIIHVKPLHEYQAQEWDQLMAVNVKSMFFSFKHAWSYLRQRPRSYVVNIGSVGSFSGQAKSASYIASKHAVLGLTRAIALDYAAEGLRCNCVCPGITDTPMLQFHMNSMPNPKQALAERCSRVPVGVALQPVDIAKAVRYLCCEDSSGVTGTMLVVDGGYTASPEWRAPHRTAFMPEETS